MKTFTSIAALAAVSSVFALPSPTEELAKRATLTPISVKGNAFFQGNTRFYIRGVDYQPGGSSDLADPIADIDGCKRDIEYFKDLNINTIRVYSVDNSVNHDECMTALAEAGIYLVLDVNTPAFSLRRDKPDISYNSDYLQNIFATIDAFAGYSNTLAFFSGNEVINDDTTTSAAPYVKAVTRDMRQYLGSRNYRQIPVGYSAADVDSNRKEMAEYMNCGPDDERSDFFAFNDYSWCDPSSFQISGWDQKVVNFTGYGLPLFLSEYGCNINTRKFEEVASLYSTDMTAVYSGGLVYEYSQEPSNYGLVTITGTGSGATIKKLADYNELKDAFKGTANPSGDGGYNSTGGASGCPSRSATWAVDGDALPAIPVAAKAYMTSGAGKGRGLGVKQDDGSQAGTRVQGGQSTGTATSGSGSVTSGSSSASASSKKNAGSSLQPMDKSPMILGFVVVAFTVLGAALI